MDTLAVRLLLWRWITQRWFSQFTCAQVRFLTSPGRADVNRRAIRALWKQHPRSA